MNEYFKLLKSNWIIFLKSVRSLSNNTIIAYENDFDSWSIFFQGHFSESMTLPLFQSITIGDIRSFIADRQQNKFNIRSTARVLAAYKNFARYLIQEGHIEDHAILNFTLGRLAKRLPRALTTSQALDLVNHIDEQATVPWIKARDKALMMLLYSLGLRISEALNLTQNCIKRDYITITGKGSKVRHVPLLQNVRDTIAIYQNLCPFLQANPLGHDGTTDFLFRGSRGGKLSTGIAQGLMRVYRRSHGLPETATPHSLRHSCATHLVESSSDLRSIQELLGHASLSSTQLYMDIAETHVKDIFNKSHPRGEQQTINRKKKNDSNVTEN